MVDSESLSRSGRSFAVWYDKWYKAVLLIPALVLLLAIVYLFSFNATHGDIIFKDVSLTGGTSITVLDAGVVSDDLIASITIAIPDVRVRVLSEFSTGEQRGLIVESAEEVDVLKSALESYLGYSLTQENSSIEFSGSTLSESFYAQLRLAIVMAFVFMAIVVFIIFRSIIPSLAVILSAFADIVMTLAVVDLMGVNLSIAGVIAFLMLIGYSVDTDILLTSRVLKKRAGSVNDRLFDSLKTGVTMTVTSIVAVGVAFLIVMGVSEVLRQIFMILLIGLGFDLLNTWFANAGILKWHVEGRRH